MTRPPAPAAAAAGAEALSRWERYDRRVLAGLVRLPACRPRHLAALLGMAEAAAQEALLRLRQRGWARDVQVSTARDVAQVWAPSPAVWASYAQAGADLAPLVASEHHLHDLLWDSEGTLAAAELVSRLAQGARERGLGVTEALRLRPSAPGAVFAGAQGMVLLVEEEWCTPLFVLVDRQEASFDRRRLLVRGWARLLAERPYMAGAMMLVVTPTREEMDQWDFLATVSRERKGIPPLPLYLATAGAIAAPWQVEWERAEGKGSTYLFPSLHRLGQVPLDLPLPFRGARAPVLPAWEGMRGKSGIRLKQPSPAGRQALVALLRHPACTAGEAAAFAGLGEEEAAKVLEGLAGKGLVREAEGRWTATEEGDRLGRRLLGRAAASQSAFPRPSLLPHHLEARSFLARLAREVRAAGGRVVVLREAPVTRREWHEGGRLVRLVPDASLTFVLGGRAVHALLEWDRGQMKGPRWRQKLIGYYGYYRHLLRHGRPLYLPLLLAVAPDPAREDAIAHAAREVLPPGLLPLVWTSNRLMIESRGVLGAAWRQAGGSTREEFWRPRPVR